MPSVSFVPDEHGRVTSVVSIRRLRRGLMYGSIATGNFRLFLIDFICVAGITVRCSAAAAFLLAAWSGLELL